MHWESVRMKLNVAFSLAVFRNASENQPENHQNRPLLADSVFCALGGRREPEKKDWPDRTDRAERSEGGCDWEVRLGGS